MLQDTVSCSSLFSIADITHDIIFSCGVRGDLQGGAETLQLSLSLPLLSGRQPGGGRGGDGGQTGAAGCRLPNLTRGQDTV